jgi:hypothetical protein
LWQKWSEGRSVSFLPEYHSDRRWECARHSAIFLELTRPVPLTGSAVLGLITAYLQISSLVRSTRLDLYLSLLKKGFACWFLCPRLPGISLLPKGYRVFFSGIKRPRRHADHSPPSRAEVKTTWSYTATRPCVFMAWCFIISSFALLCLI